MLKLLLQLFKMKYLICTVSVLLYANLLSAHSHGELKNDPRSNGDLALWIDEKQVKMFSGLYTK